MSGIINVAVTAIGQCISAADALEATPIAISTKTESSSGSAPLASGLAALDASRNIMMKYRELIGQLELKINELKKSKVDGHKEIAGIMNLILWQTKLINGETLSIHTRNCIKILSETNKLVKITQKNAGDSEITLNNNKSDLKQFLRASEKLIVKKSNPVYRAIAGTMMMLGAVVLFVVSLKIGATPLIMPALELSAAGYNITSHSSGKKNAPIQRETKRLYEWTSYEMQKAHNIVKKSDSKTETFRTFSLFNWHKSKSSQENNNENKP